MRHSAQIAVGGEKRRRRSGARCVSKVSAAHIRAWGHGAAPWTHLNATKAVAMAVTPMRAQIATTVSKRFLRRRFPPNDSDSSTSEADLAAPSTSAGCARRGVRSLGRSRLPPHTRFGLSSLEYVIGIVAS